MRTEFVAGLQSSLMFYQLDIDYELIFAGDAGAAQAGRLSRRIGFEVNNNYRAASAIGYYYESRLANEAMSVADVHFHPIESRSARLTLTTSF